jgi:hypothetical protein
MFLNYIFYLCLFFGQFNFSVETFNSDKLEQICTIEKLFLYFSKDIFDKTGVNVAALLEGCSNLDKQYRFNKSNIDIVDELTRLLFQCGVLDLDNNPEIHDSSVNVKNYFKYLISICNKSEKYLKSAFNIAIENKVAVTDIKKEDVNEIYLSGDVHGSISWTIKILNLIKNYRHGDAAIFVGDIMDRDYEYHGLGSLANLILFSALNTFSQKYNIPIVCVRGNHDSVSSLLNPNINHWIANLVFNKDYKKLIADKDFIDIMKNAFQSIFPINHVLKINDKDDSYSIITNHGFGADVFKNRIETNNEFGKITTFHNVDLMQDVNAINKKLLNNALGNDFKLINFVSEEINSFYNKIGDSDDLFSSWTDPVHVEIASDLNNFNGRVPFPVLVMKYFIKNNFDFSENNKWIMHVGHSHSGENVPNIIQENSKGRICVIPKKRSKKVTKFPGYHKEDFVESGFSLKKLEANFISLFSPPIVFGNKFGSFFSSYKKNIFDYNFIYTIYFNKKTKELEILVENI